MDGPIYHHSTPLPSHVDRCLGFLLTRIRVTGGARGVLLLLKATHIA